MQIRINIYIMLNYIFVKLSLYRLPDSANRPSAAWNALCSTITALCWQNRFVPLIIIRLIDHFILFLSSRIELVFTSNLRRPKSDVWDMLVSIYPTHNGLFRTCLKIRFLRIAIRFKDMKVRRNRNSGKNYLSEIRRNSRRRSAGSLFRGYIMLIKMGS